MLRGKRDRPLFTGTSHDPGRNAIVELWPDRIERTKARSRTSISRAHQDVELTPVRAITSMQATKDGIRRTKITVYASGNNVEFRFEHREARDFQAVLTPLITGAAAPTPTPTPPPPAPSPPPPPGPPAGWHPDPTGRHEHRYWDGTAWTAQVSDHGVPSIDPHGSS